MEITRRSVLLDALAREESVMAACSVDGKRLEPMPGLTEMFNAQGERCRLLREMIQAMETDGVRREMAKWQRDVMEGHGVEITTLDRVPPIKEDRMVF